MQYLETIQSIERLVKDQVVPGVNYAFIDEDGVQRYLIGDRQLLPVKKPLDNGHLIYDMASLTKVVGTTMVILKLAELGKLSLDDSISKYLPKWKFSEVTIRNLICHTSGIEGYIPNRDKLNHDELIDALLGLHVGLGLNKEMHYADVNFIFLGLIAKQITGESIHQLITEYVLQPLKMDNSSFHPNPDDCVPTVYDDRHGLLQGTVHDPKAQVLGDDCGSAGLFSNMDDLIKFVQSILHPSENPVLSEETLAGFYKDQTGYDLGRTYGFERLDYGGMHYIWQSGFTGTFIVIIPEKKRAMIFLSNRVHPVSPNEEFIERRAPLIVTYLKANKKDES